MVYEKNHTDKSKIFSSEAYQKIQREYRQNNKMIYGEAMVFICLLVLVAMKIHSGIKKEIILNRQQRNFLLSITHELKSPIAGIQLALETLSKHHLTLSPDKAEKLLNNSHIESERLANLVESLLMASKLEGESLVLQKEDILLDELIGYIIKNMRDRFGHHKKFFLETNGPVEIFADRFAWHTIIINLLENAVKYSGPDAAIGVRLLDNESWLSIEFWDEGIGISEEDKKNIFKKFYRTGNEDTRQTKGTGLGLFIVKQLVELHKGIIKVEKNFPQGSCITISIPKTGIVNDFSDAKISSYGIQENE